MHSTQQKPFYRTLFFQVLAALVLGVVLGYVDPDTAVTMKPLGDAFIKLIKMLIAPIIFCTMVTGIAGMGSMKQVGRVGLKALLVFEVLTTLALVIGWALVNFFRPGANLNIDFTQLDTGAVEEKIAHTGMLDVVDFFMNMIPTTFVSAFSDGEMLQVLLVAILFAFGLTLIGSKGREVVALIESLSQVLFKMVDIVTYAAPIGVFGTMAYTVGKFGIGSLKELGSLIAIFYFAGFLFVFLILAPMLHYYCRLNIFKFLKYIREELSIVLGTASSEMVLPRLMEKLAVMGCSRQVVRLVVSTGYSFNLDGSCLYLTMGAMFICYATHTSITFWQELGLFSVLLITSKGAAGVTGSAFLVLAATLSSITLIPQQNLVMGLALIFSIDRFMSTGRAIVNLIGNGVTTIVLAKWENALDHKQAVEVLSGRKNPELKPL